MSQREEKMRRIVSPRVRWTQAIVFVMVCVLVAPAVVLASEPQSPTTGPIGLSSYNLGKDAATRWKLPGCLTEISGLAMAPDGRLFAHNDEVAIVYEVDYLSGEIVKAFGLANLGQTIADDLEGIAFVDDTAYMVTSAGRIYEFPEGEDGEHVTFNVYDSGVGCACEIEGLAFDPCGRVLLILCKNPLVQELAGKVGIYRWSVDNKRTVEGGHTLVDMAEILAAIDKKKFQPSGIEVHPESGNYFLVAARQGSVTEVTPNGRVVAAMRFPAKWHRQAEGITFAPDYTMIVSDEGAGKSARLTLYPISRSE